MNNSTGNENVLYGSPLWSRITERMRQNPGKICIQDTKGRGLTYRELVSKVDVLASHLVSHGFAKDDRTFFLAQPTIRSIIYFLATLRTGGTIVAADAAMGRDAFRSRLKLSNPKWILLDPRLAWIRAIPLLGALLRMIGMQIPDLGTDLDATFLTAYALPESDADTTAASETELPLSHDALIVFTSGTTDKPKAVVHNYESIMATLDLIATDLSPADTDIFYASQTYFLFMALLSGASAVLPVQARFSARRFVSDLYTFGITKVFALPAECEETIDHCVRTRTTLPIGLKTIMLGSAPVLTGFLRRFAKIVPTDTEVLCIYGATEILPIARVTMQEKLTFAGKGDLLGYPCTGTQVRIENDEIVATGPNLCRSYLESGHLNEFKTGDLGSIDDSGRIVLHGRKKDMIIRGNHNIYPALFESSIRSIDGVRDCALIGVYREDSSDEEIVLVVERTDMEPEHVVRARLLREMRTGPHSIDSYALPDRILFMRLPLAGRSKKVDKIALREHVKRI